MMSEEDRNRMAQEIWAKSAEEIEKSITYAISYELRGDIQSRARKIVDSEMDKILRPMIDARREEMILAAEKIVEKIFRQMEDKVLSKMEQDLRYHSEDAFSRFAQSLAGGMKAAALGEVTRAFDEVRTAREKAYLERKAAQEKP